MCLCVCVCVIFTSETIIGSTEHTLETVNVSLHNDSRADLISIWKSGDQGEGGGERSREYGLHTLPIVDMCDVGCRGAALLLHVRRCRCRRAPTSPCVYRHYLPW